MHVSQLPIGPIAAGVDAGQAKRRRDSHDTQLSRKQKRRYRVLLNAVQTREPGPRTLYRRQIAIPRPRPDQAYVKSLQQRFSFALDNANSPDLLRVEPHPANGSQAASASTLDDLPDLTIDSDDCDGTVESID